MSVWLVLLILLGFVVAARWRAAWSSGEGLRSREILGALAVGVVLAVLAAA